MGSFVRAVLSALMWVGVVAMIVWLLVTHDALKLLFSGRALDWGMGIVCFLWLLIILKAPWDLYFQSRTIAFELQRARERSIQPQAEREAYVLFVGRRLLILAIASHLSPRCSSRPLRTSPMGPSATTSQCCTWSRRCSVPRLPDMSTCLTDCAPSATRPTIHGRTW